MLIILSVFFTLIVFMGTVSAASDDNATLSQETDDIINKDNTDEILTSEVSSAGNEGSGLKELDNGNKSMKNLLASSEDENILGSTINVEGNTFTDIQNAINNANEGDTIYLQSPYYTGLGTEITISKKLTIIGFEGCTLDAQQQSRIFVSNSTITLNNIKFINVTTQSVGGAIYITKSADSSVVNCSFMNCSGSNRGGAVHIIDSAGSDVVNCSFINCSSSANGGAVYFYNSADSSVVNCSFMNCYGSSFGGAVYLSQDSNIVNCSFVKCSISRTSTSSSSDAGSGGAVYLSRNSSIVNCSFVNCSSSKKGGAVYLLSSTRFKIDNSSKMINCSFVNCSSSNSADTNGCGGAVYFVSGSIDNCSFVNCSSSHSSESSGGGAVYLGPYSSMANCSFVNCSSSKGGGGAVQYSSLIDGYTFYSPNYIVNCSFVNCSSSKDGSAVLSDSSSVVNCSFINCSSKDSYGTVVIFGQSVVGSVLNCSFVNCYAKGPSAIYLSSHNRFPCSVANCSFLNCHNFGDASLGGTVYTGGYAISSVVNCSFMNCSSSTRGGAVDMASVVDSSVVNCSFINCFSSANYSSSYNYGGGAIYLSSSNSAIHSVDNCSFMNCSSNYGGGAIYVNNLVKSFNVINSTFMNCSAEKGSAINSALESGSVVNSIFIDNKANSNHLEGMGSSNYQYRIKFSGGDNYINAIYAHPSATITFKNVSYWNGSIVNSDNLPPVKSGDEIGINITVEVYNSQGNLVDNVTLMTDNKGQIYYDYSNLNYEKYSFKSYHPEDRYYTYIETTGSFMGPKKYNIVILNNQTYYGINNIPTKLNATIKDNQTGNNINPSNTKLLFIHPKSNRNLYK